MKTSINNLRARLGTCALQAAVWSQTISPTAADMRLAARTGLVGTLLVSGAAAMAQAGLATGFQNATSLVKIIISFIAVMGVLGGMGFMFSAAADMYKKADGSGRGDDITWAKIAMKWAAGAVAMALTYFGTQVVLTLGGSQGDIGRVLAN